MDFCGEDGRGVLLVNSGNPESVSEGCGEESVEGETGIASELIRMDLFMGPVDHRDFGAWIVAQGHERGVVIHSNPKETVPPFYDPGNLEKNFLERNESNFVS